MHTIVLETVTDLDFSFMLIALPPDDGVGSPTQVTALSSFREIGAVIRTPDDNSG